LSTVRESLTPEEFDHLAVRPVTKAISPPTTCVVIGAIRETAGSERTGIGSLNIGDAEAEVQQSAFDRFLIWTPASALCLHG
jgi:hypothetical protein